MDSGLYLEVDYIMTDKNIDDRTPLQRIASFWMPPVYGSRVTEEIWRERLLKACRDWIKELRSKGYKVDV